ncbi:MAG: hypothetical protein JXQ83_08115 [Candidatus Glassbacteria bacterium]|nr:hypothetical protein [Candidatus Glassbacteria bacterium]
MNFHHLDRRLTGLPLLSALALSLAVCSCTLEPPPKKVPVSLITVAGESIEVQLRSNDGLVTSLTHSETGTDLLGGQADSLGSPVFGIEVYDELESTSYSDLRDSSFITDFSGSESGVSFTKQFIGAPFSLEQRITRSDYGIQLRCRSWCEDIETPLRSVRFTYLIPAPKGYFFWVPGMEIPLRLDGENAVHYRYGCGELSDKATGIPLAVLWKTGGAGLSIGVPLEIKTVRVSFSIDPSVHSSPPAGSFPTSEDFSYLRVTFDLVGIGPGRPLETGLWIYGHQDDWRPAVKIFAETYREFFEGAPRAQELAGIPGTAEPGGADPAAVRRLLQLDAGLARIDWNYQRPGQWIPPQAVRFNDFTWACQADPQKYSNISVQQIRFLVDALRIAKLQPVLYAAYNQRCDPELALSRFSADIARDELGNPLATPGGHLLMHAAPASPFGRQILEQQQAMTGLFPEAAGFFFDDLAVAGVDFAHDDSLTVIHNRPACNLGDTFNRLGPLLTRMVHDAGKLVVAGVPQTISACAGIDVLCLEKPENIGTVALMGLNRPTLAIPPAGSPSGAREIECQLQKQLVWGILPSTGQLETSPEISRAYRQLYLSIKGRRWVLEPHALTLPEGVQGQLFQVPSVERPGRTDYLATVVRPGVLLADESLRRGVVVRVRIPDAEYLVRAFWTPAAVPSWPLPVKTVFAQGELSVELPPFGPAGVLRLSRR